MHNKDNGKIYTKIQGRYIVLAWILPMFIFLIVGNLVYDSFEDIPWFWIDIGYIYTYQGLLFLVLVSIFFFKNIDWRILLGKKIVKTEVNPALKLTVFIMLFSIAAAYALFIPLSYIIPEFVQWWYLDSLYIFYYGGDSYPFMPNLLNFLSLVVVAPIIEEIAFRGLLLHRWVYKLGLINAVLLSSFVFGFIHPDPIGAMVFGIGMCVIYLKTQSLILPIICHSFNNLVVWFLTLGYEIYYGPNYIYTIEEFRSEWYIGVIFGFVTIVWVFVYFKENHSKKSWKLPDI